MNTEQSLKDFMLVQLLYSHKNIGIASLVFQHQYIDVSRVWQTLLSL